MKKIILFLTALISIVGISFSQIAPAGSVMWNDEISNVTATDWNMLNNGDGIIEMTGVALLDTAWASDGNGYIHISSNGTGGAVSLNQYISVTLSNPYILPTEGKEHLAFVFEQLYTKRHSETYIGYSYDGINWDSIEINKYVNEDSTIRRFVPMKIPVDTSNTELYIKFIYLGTPDATMNAEWMIDNIKIVQLPVVKIVPNKIGKVCDGDSVILTPTIINSNTGSVNLEWGGSDQSNPIVVKAPQTLNLRASVPFPGANYSSHINTLNSDKDSITVDFKYVYQDEEVFLATVDPESGKNLVVWKKTNNERTEFFRLYSGPINNENFVGQVPYNELPVFIDPYSEPKKLSSRYKITVVDSCGNESFYSQTHATMYLSLLTLTNNSIELNWSKYDGFSFDKYYIYKGSSSANLFLADSVSSSVTSYIDDSPFPDSSFYRIEINRGEIYDPSFGKKSNSGPFSRSLSNIEDNRQQSTLSKENILSSSFTIFPNPIIGSAYINYSLSQKALVQLDIVNILGQTVFEITASNQEKGQYKYKLRKEDLSENNGIYFVKLKIDDHSFVKKIIVN